MKINYQSLEKKIDIKFKNKDLLIQALTHKSFNQNEKILPTDLSDEKKINRAFPTKLSLCTYPTLDRNLLSLEQSLLSPKKK